ncbi:MAG: hypothetical protein ACFBSG_00155 [Leptolyngbyaceae cyanobacterium]
MVIVIPLETTERLMQTTQQYQLSLPIPLSSRCASYLSPAEMDLILVGLQPFSPQNDGVHRLVSELQLYRTLENPVVPCEG